MHHLTTIQLLFSSLMKMLSQMSIMISFSQSLEYLYSSQLVESCASQVTIDSFLNSFSIGFLDCSLKGSSPQALDSFLFIIHIQLSSLITFTPPRIHFSMTSVILLVEIIVSCPDNCNSFLTSLPESCFSP